MTDIYCGVGKIPKGNRIGTMQECAEKKQVRMYGIKKIDPKTLDLLKQKDILPETREKLILMMSSLRGAIRRNKGRYETTKDAKLKPEYYKIWQKAEKDLVKVVSKLKKIEERRDAEKNKLKSSSKTATKTMAKVASKSNTSVKKTKKVARSKSKAPSKAPGKPKSKAPSKPKSKAPSKPKSKAPSKALSKSTSKPKSKALSNTPIKV